MNIQPYPLARAVGTALVASLLAACAGGGQQLVVADPPPPAVPPPVVPPPNAPPELCPAPISGDCTVSTSGRMLGGRDSPGGLKVLSHAELRLGTDDPSIDARQARATYAFATGVDLDGGELYVAAGNTLKASVRVHAGSGSFLRASGTVVGRVDNAGAMQLFPGGIVSGPVFNDGEFLGSGGRIEGDLRNSGTVFLPGSIYGDPSADFRVGGAFIQTTDGRLRMVLPPAGLEKDFSGRLMVDGRADLAGVLQLLLYSDGWGPYPAPGLQTFHLIHADGGIAGAFDRFEYVGVFLDGKIHYDANSVWFELTRTTASGAMAASAQATPLTLASATNLDRALTAADVFARAPTSSQQVFLANAGRLLRIADEAQAVRAIDSLSGAPQVEAASAAFEAATPAGVAHRLDQRTYDAGSTLWIDSRGADVVAGIDHWLSPRLLFGVHTFTGDDSGRALLGGSIGQQDHGAGLHLRRVFDGGGYAGINVAYAQRHAVLQRPIDFGSAGRWLARSERRFDVTTLGGEVGRTLPWRGARLTPFLRMDASVLQASRSVEAGDSGFELALAQAQQQRVQAAGGLRLAQDWRRAGNELRLEAGAGVSRVLLHAGDPLRASYTGVPDVWFELPEDARLMRAWLQLGLSGTAGSRWGWSLFGEHRSGARTAWQLQLVRGL